ncbi:lichenan-specific phosphotransferase enzyme IIA component [Anaerocolumna cellulosilytica]|uniref:Lichenan-specific phosphotransferase enzyme IIA component n=1 Tax=Anaerocolumna cellulosilytica TaxID=433286 RepID=A0A6S6R127_9FIRM|nr:PTS lactose/cellobiose transporter subunit IIA [Anaerocolumna cellulosilytica]MBB5194309.1 PTS system cellobiose-specific IIA component [Anaerocolumna cellulosilytica]BCJ93252.1 lichenan-specific phosphotransferase enzyme IIA component [Anaerocolumna cellulosilytica]
MEVSLEEIITELVVNGGDAKSKAIEAIRLAKTGNFETAEVKINEANESLQKAHEFQTEIIQAESRGENKAEVSLLMVHGQDHLMNAITTRDLAIEMVEMYKMILNK